MLPQNLKYLREMHKMEQLELAQKLGRKSSSSVSEWEKGKYTPKIGVLKEISKIFEVEIDDLMSKNLRTSISKKDINFIYNQLNKQNQENVYEYAEMKLNKQKQSKVVKLPEEQQEINTIAAHHEGRDFTEEELPEVMNYIDQVFHDNFDK